MTNNSSADQVQPASPSSASGPTRIPGTYPPEWLPDQEASSCMSCDSQFTLVKRRHHCRSCGKIFCSDCCRLKARLLYMDDKEARVCNHCFDLIDRTLTNNDTNNPILQPSTPELIASSSQPIQGTSSPRVQGVLKQSGNQSRASSNECNTPTSSPTDQQSNKQVMFADGIRPGTDLSEAYVRPAATVSAPTSNSQPNPKSLLTRVVRVPNGARKDRKSQDRASSTITVCDDLGYLPPIIVSESSAIVNFDESGPSSSSNSLVSLIIDQLKLSSGSSGTSTGKSLQSSMESRSCPLNGVMKFEELAELVGDDGLITFILLKDFHLKVKLIDKTCCSSKRDSGIDCELNGESGETAEQILASLDNKPKTHWCFTSEGLSKFSQSEIVLVIDKEETESCIPRDIFKIYLTLHELSLRRQSFENLGNLLFQDGLFGNRDIAGLIFVKPYEEHCLQNLILPSEPFLIALILQRWEVPWSKVFPIRLLLRLGHKAGVYPCPITSLRTREPVFYEIGHTIISILGDFRNFRYSITHVEGMKVMIIKSSKVVRIQLDQSYYQQFNKVLDAANNEHVLAWSSGPFPEANGHLVSVQDEDGHYETREFLKTSSRNVSFQDLGSEVILGASFIVFSGALKVNHGGQPAKISIVEDGLLIQIQSCTMSALRSAIQYMNNFEIDCESNSDPLNRVEINWKCENT